MSMFEIKMWIGASDLADFNEFIGKLKTRQDERDQLIKAAIEAPYGQPTPPAPTVESVKQEIVKEGGRVAPTIVNEPKASVFTEEDVANATRELAQKKGIDTASALLKSFEIARARDLPVEKRTQYIEQAKALQAVSE